MVIVRAVVAIVVSTLIAGCVSMEEIGGGMQIGGAGAASVPLMLAGQVLEVVGKSGGGRIAKNTEPQWGRRHSVKSSAGFIALFTKTKRRELLYWERELYVNARTQKFAFLEKEEREALRIKYVSEGSPWVAIPYRNRKIEVVLLMYCRAIEENCIVSLPDELPPAVMAKKLIPEERVADP